MSEGLPTQTFDSDLFTLRFENLTLNDACVLATTRDVGGEDKTF